MLAIPIRGLIDADGTLKLQVPTGLPQSEVDVVVVVQAVTPSSTPLNAAADWPAFVNALYGSTAEFPLERAPQGEFDNRDTLD